MAKEPGNTCVLCGYHPVEIVDILREGKASSRTARKGEVRAARPIAGEAGAVCYLCAPDFDGLLKTAIQTSANYQYARRVISECAAIAQLQPGQLIDVRLRGLMQQLEEQALVIQSHERWRKTDREAIRGLMAMVDGQNILLKQAGQERPFQPTMGSASLDDLRYSGWLVVAHTDQQQSGIFSTKWVLGRGELHFTGEGFSDAEALDQIRHQIEAMETSESEIPSSPEP